MLSLPHKAQPTDRSAQTEAGALCTKPECYDGLKPDATVIQEANLCYKTLPKHCREVPVKYTKCYTFSPKKAEKSNAMLSGCKEGALDALYSTIVTGKDLF